MKKKYFSCAGSEEQYDPSLIEEIVKDFLEHSNSPFATAYRRQQAEQASRQQQARLQATRTEGLRPNTELCVDLKTLLRTDSRMQAGKSYTGTLTRDIICDEFLYDDQHFTFTESTPQTVRRNPQVFNGKYVTITRRSNGTYRANLKPIEIGDGFDIVGYATQVGNELLWALEGLIGEGYENEVPRM